MSILFKHKINWQYAIGEIILIFIGITLAIAFNNWNEDNKERDKISIKKTQFIKSFYSAIDKDAYTFQEWANSFISQEEWARYVGDILESNEKVIEDSLRFINNYRDASLTFVVNQRPIVWNELNSSENQELIEDDALMEHLNQYYVNYNYFFQNFFNVPFEKRMSLRSIDQKMFRIDENADYTEDNEFDKIPSKETFDAILNDKEILGLIRSIVVSASFQSKYLKDLIEEAENILLYLEKNYSKILDQEQRSNTINISSDQ